MSLKVEGKNAIFGHRFVHERISKNIGHVQIQWL